MDKCIGCHRFKYDPETDEWECTSPYKHCHKEELEYVERQRRMRELFGNEGRTNVIRNR